MKTLSIIRLRFITVGIILFALVIVAKLYSVQVVSNKVFAERADRQYIKPNQDLFDRGSIFFETKGGSLLSAATVKEGYVLVMNPKLVTNAEEAYTSVRELVVVDHDYFIEKSTHKNEVYIEIAKKVDADVGAALNEEAIPGIRAYKDNWRVYPGNGMAAHTVGIIGYDSGNELAGRYGLERTYEDVLKRTSGSVYRNFFAEIFSNIQSKIVNGESLEGDVVATIEPTVENYLEGELKDTLKKWKADEIGGIIINPKTGEIYAMDSLPSFNPNDVKSVADPKVFSNPLVENVYEMGSIIKPLTMAAGIDTHTVTADSTYDDKGFIMVSGKKISNWDGKGRGVTTMQEVLSQSLNTGVAYVVSKMGKDAFRDYMQRYGLGQVTGIDQPNEQAGIVSNLKSGRDVELATASFGQGIAMTPIETVRALSAIANGGTLITPHLVKRIDYKVGVSKDVEVDPGVRVIRKESSDEITRMLVQVVDKALKHGQVKFDNYSVAAKTGTAQIADPVNGGYYSDRYLHSFFGYFPAYNPKFLVFLYHVHPKGAEYASETLTDPFIDIVKFLINYYQIPPDR